MVNIKRHLNMMVGDPTCKLAGICDSKDWRREIVRRAATLPMVKAFGTILFMVLFFWAYLNLLRHPLFSVRVMPLTAVDRLVGFTPAALPLYLSLWFYVSLPPALLDNLRDLVRYGCFAGGLCLIGIICFLLWPTAIPVASLDWGAHPGIALLKGVDAAGNACPSLHVATAVFSAIWLDCLLRKIGVPRVFMTVNWLWCAGIVYSALAIRQHVFLDVVAGGLLGGLVGGLSLTLGRSARSALEMKT
ncbi:MAG: phosphatase PAP2 family protein [Georgfuchsia sp.]